MEKNGEEITYKERKSCVDKAFEEINDKRYMYLKRKHKDNYIELRKNEKEYQEILFYFKKETELIRQCYYELGYRFTGPIYWCLAQDNGHNTKTCMENLKYRN